MLSKGTMDLLDPFHEAHPLSTLLTDFPLITYTGNEYELFLYVVLT